MLPVLLASDCGHDQNISHIYYNTLLLQSFKAEQSSVMMGGIETTYTLNVSQTIPLGQPPHFNSSFICQFNASISHQDQYFRDLQSCITLLRLQLLTNTTFCRYFLGYKVQLQILSLKLLKLWTTKWPCWEYLTFATFQLLVWETGQHKSRATTVSEWQTMRAVITLTNWTLPLQKQKDIIYLEYSWEILVK